MPKGNNVIEENGSNQYRNKNYEETNLSENLYSSNFDNKQKMTIQESSIENTDQSYEKNSFFSNEKSDISNGQKKIIYDNLNKIIEESGYNLITFKTIFFGFMFVFLEGFYLTFFGNIALAFQNYYKISNSYLSFISSLCFLGMACGNFTLGAFLLILSRKQIILMSIIGLLTTHLCMSLIHNLILFVICRFIGSVFLGYYMVLIFNILTEYLPVKLRGFVMNFIWIGWNLGAIYFLLLCKVYIPDLNYTKENHKVPQNFYMAMFNFIYFYIINLILVYLFLEDSPRNLLVNHQKDKAANILKYYIGRKLSNEEMDSIYNKIINSGENKFHKGKEENNINQLFSKRFISMSILMMLIYFLLSFAMFGITVSLPMILRYIEISQKNIVRNINIYKFFKFNLFSLKI